MHTYQGAKNSTNAGLLAISLSKLLGVRSRTLEAKAGAMRASAVRARLWKCMMSSC